MSEIIKKHYLEDEDYNESVELIKKIFKELREITKNHQLNYLGKYIGIRAENCTATNFIAFIPLQRAFVKMAFKLEKTKQRDELIKKNGLDHYSYNEIKNIYYLKINEIVLNTKFETIRTLAKKAKDDYPFKNTDGKKL